MAGILSKPKMPAKTADELAAAKFQAKELKRLKTEERGRKSALTRAQGGRRSLLSGAETGLSETLG